jgi:small subunit ribosomal protein S13
VKDLNDNDLIKIRTVIEKNFKVEGDLRREVSLNIKKKKK